MGITCLVQFANAAAQRHSAWHPNHDAHEDPAAAAGALNRTTPITMGTVMQRQGKDGDGDKGNGWVAEIQVSRV